MARTTNKTPQRKRLAKRLPRPIYTRAELAAIFERFRLERPEPKGELEHRDAYTLVVAVALSAQATDKGVNLATRRLFAEAADPATMLTLGEDRVRELIKTIGLYRNKAANVIALSQRLVDEFDGTVPRDREALMTLPGVGRKTANVVLNMWWGEETFAVDTHVFRLGNRMRIAPGRTPDDVERVLDARVPQPYRRDAHHWLILHGRYTCLARKPRCETCCVRDLCRAKENPFREKKNG